MLSTAALTQRCSAKPTGGLCVLSSYFCCYRHHEGVCRWLVSRADPFFVWPKEEAFYENEPPFHHPILDCFLFELQDGTLSATVSTTRSLVLAALFLALAFVLPMITGHVPQVGNMLCPMHFPILLCGFVLGGPWGLAVGFIAPLVRSVLFGMPPMFPIAIAMAFELAAYGLVSGVLWHKVKHTVPMMYASLVTAMVAGRLVWGAVRFVLAGLTGSSFPFSAFLSGALLTAVPGIVAQLVLIPLILIALQKAKFMD